jgi:hypothetical protein
LYEAQKRHAPGQLGDNATKEFVLRHVFEIAPELIKQPSDLLRALLRRHYRGQRIPTVLDDRFVQLLPKKNNFDDWSLETLVSDREAFFAFLQERWPIFLDLEATKRASGVREERSRTVWPLRDLSMVPFYSWMGGVGPASERATLSLPRGNERAREEPAGAGGQRFCSLGLRHWK